MNTRKCNKCKQCFPKTEEFWYVRSNGKYYSPCKDCMKLIANTFNAKPVNRIEARKNGKRYRCKMSYRHYVWSRNANQRGIPFHITIEDLESMPLVCYYTGKALTLQANSYYTVSLDRLNSEKAYTKDNVVFCCSFINFMKSTLTYDQFIVACRTIVHYHDNRNSTL